MRSRSLHASRGVTLIELMIVVAIVGILAALAYPSYLSSVIRSNRADAMQSLLQAAQNMERYYVVNGAAGYSNANTNGNPSPSRSPASGTQIYAITFSAGPNANSFTLKATPVAGKANAADGYLEINNLGLKRWDRNNDGSITTGTEDNWNR